MVYFCRLSRAILAPQSVTRGPGRRRRENQRKGVLVARKGDFTEILLRKRVISQDQLNEARQVSKDQNTSLPETIIKLGYASGEE